MLARFQVVASDEVILDTEMHATNRFAALHKLLKVCQVDYDPTHFEHRGDWVQFKTGRTIYRTSTRFG